MLKLLYDLKVGYRECYLTVLDEELDVSAHFHLLYLNMKEAGIAAEEQSDEELYEQYKFDIDGLLKFLEDTGCLEGEYEASVLHYTKNFFSSVTEPGTCCGIWEPSNWRLVYDPGTVTTQRYLSSLSSKEVCEMLKISRQQLHYYVKNEMIRKVINPDNPTTFKYDRGDVYILRTKLNEKYKKYSN